MAGYGTTLSAPSQFDQLIRALMRAAQRRARSTGLRMRYRCQPASGHTDWDISVDGNGYVIAAWSQQLARDLPVVAEGFVGDGEGRRARNIAVSLVARWTDWCVGDSENTTVSATGSDKGKFFWPVIDVPVPPHALAPRLAQADELVGRWIVQDIPPEAAIEELHTSVEGVLRSILGVGKGPNWPALLDRAERAGFIAEPDRLALESFSTLYRTRLKHHALAVAEAERVATTNVMWDVLGICESLLGHVS